MDIVNKISYPVDLIEVKRWVEDDDQLLLVDKLEQEKRVKPTPASGLQTYDAEFYKKEYNKSSATDFLKYVRDVESIVKKKGWPLETKYNKHYCSFKAGFFNAFGVRWVGSKTFAFFFKLDQDQAARIPIDMTKYDNSWKEAQYYINPKETNTEDFLPLFEISYKELTGD